MKKKDLLLEIFIGILQISFFVTLYEIGWRLAKSYYHIKSDIGWGILIEKIFYYFILLSLISTTTRFFFPKQKKIIAIIFTFSPLIILFFLNFHIIPYRLIFILIILITSILVPFLLSHFYKK